LADSDCWNIDILVDLAEFQSFLDGLKCHCFTEGDDLDLHDILQSQVFHSHNVSLHNMPSFESDNLGKGFWCMILLYFHI